MGAPEADINGSSSGDSYVIFGQSGTSRTRIDTGTLAASDGFIIRGDSVEGDDLLGYSVSSAGDVNGDGIDDLIVGAYYGDDGGSDAGEAYVIFGSSGVFGTNISGRQVIDTTNLTAAQGFIIQGDASADHLGNIGEADVLFHQNIGTPAFIEVIGHAFVIIGAAESEAFCANHTIACIALHDHPGFTIRMPAADIEQRLGINGQ